jgi:hypothetical protein
MTNDASPFLNGQPAGKAATSAAVELIRRRKKFEHDEEQRRLRDPKYKNRKSNEHNL